MKTLASLSTVVVVALTGLTVAPAAHAEPYPHSVDTQCHAVMKKNPVKRGVAPVVRYSWTTIGTAAPTGTVAIKVVRRKTGMVVARASRDYAGRRTSFSLRPLQRRGKYTVVLVARAGASSVFTDCTTRTAFRVKR